MSNNVYENYDLTTGNTNNWRMSAKWPKAGKGGASVWGVHAILLLVSLFFGGFIPFLWELFYLVVILNVICIFKSMNLLQFKRLVLQKMGVKAKRATPFWRHGSNFGLVLCVLASSVMMTPPVNASFEIIVPKASPQVDPMIATGEPLIEGGFGRNVKMVDLLFQILPKPYEAEFYNSEIQDMKVSWYAKGRVYLNAVFADISRRHGLLFTWKPSSGLLNVSWDTGQCRKVIAEHDKQRAVDADTYKTKERARPAFIRQVINDVTGEVIVC
ncbi:hypothetical protein HNW13_018095 [Shewanella sp. BF02_Schw]|uniref:hypothetical protein n=1 Tax=Shewanella sp. BF02_Schw TaxID=394908 RepID=UPI00177FC7C5|nr:hypothetical protein [Shewanella sp. BF02_Schw]MBO1897652.1 hypothetical protein [Shewanella sp. BF02_Schw]